MKSKFILLFLIMSIQLIGQWTELESGSTEWLRGIWFIDNNEGIAVGYNGEIIKTQDAGETWMKIESNTTINLFSIFFPNNETGYITGANGLVLKSTDKGNTWTIIREGGGTLHESYFLTSELGYIAGEGGNVLKTVDGGLNWDILSLGSYNGKVSVFFNNEDVGYFVGIGGSDAIMKTKDGGNSFEGLFNGATSEFSSIFFTDLNKGFACSTTNPKRIIRTNDGGQNWEVETFNFDQGLYAIKFIDSENGLVVGGFPDACIILNTSDGGDSWIEEFPPSNEPLFDVFMLSKNFGFAVGRNGTILRQGELVSTNELEFQSIEIFPNPTENYIVIRDESNVDLINYSLTNSKGVLVKNGTVNQNEPIDIHEIISGFYILTLFNDGSLKSFKIVKK